MEKFGLEIGPGEEGTIHEIMAIEQDSSPSPWTENMFREELNSSISRVLVARTVRGQGGCVAGYVVYWLVADEVHLHNIAVRRDLRRNQVASRLLEEAIRRAQIEGARWMTLEVRRSNLPARRFYEKFGLSIQGVRPGYYTERREDALIMGADLRRMPGEQCSTAVAGEGNDG